MLSDHQPNKNTRHPWHSPTGPSCSWLNTSPSLTGKIFRTLDFHWKRNTGRITVPEEPYLSDTGHRIFLEHLSRANYYLEYGSGGSTVTAARLKRPFTTVESDKKFLQAVIRKIGRADPNTFIHVSVGLTDKAGTPMFRLKPLLKKWGQQYAEAPWLRAPTPQPNLILIDGRFRVASTLESIKQCVRHGIGSQVTILIDDYDRPLYHIVEKYLQLKSCQGGLATFKIKENIDLNELENLQQEYYHSTL